MELKKIELSKIKPYEKNARKNDDAVEYVIKSIEQCEYIAPIILDENNVILAGHTRYKALKKLGYKEAECIIKEGLTEEQKKKYRLLDNKTAEFAEWDFELLEDELSGLDFGDLDIDWGIDENEANGFSDYENNEEEQILAPSCQHNVFENQEIMQFESNNKYGFPEIEATQTSGDKMLRFMDWMCCEDPENYIVHFYYDDYRFMSAWREPNKYVDRLKKFKAVVSPDFSLYTDFPKALQILSCYRRQWCGAYWQSLGIDIIPDVVWGDKETFEFCFDGIPKNSTVAVSTVGVKRDPDWNGKNSTLFIDGYNEMIKRLNPKTVILYGDIIDGIEGDNIINVPSYYAEMRERWNKNG